MYRTSPKYLHSALICVQIYFNLAEYDRADVLVQEMLKKYPKHAEGLYWQGLVAFYTYLKEKTQDRVKKSLAIKAENALLRIFARFPLC